MENQIKDLQEKTNFLEYRISILQEAGRMLNDGDFEIVEHEQKKGAISRALAESQALL